MSTLCPLTNERVLYTACLECEDRICRDPDGIFALLIAGSRSFDDYERLRDTADYLLSGQQGRRVLIVEGAARGADRLAARYASERGFYHLSFPADWSRGKRAGYERNRRMHSFIAGFAHRGVLLFWDGTSRGTAQSIDLAREFGSPLRTYLF